MPISKATRTTPSIKACFAPKAPLASCSTTPPRGCANPSNAWASAALGIGVTDKLSVFFEVFGFNREEARGPNTATFQAGVVYLLSPDLQLDLRAARRLTDRGVDLLVGVGVSWLLGG